MYIFLKESKNNFTKLLMIVEHLKGKVKMFNFNSNDNGSFEFYMTIFI